MPNFTNLDLINQCDTFPYPDSPDYVTTLAGVIQVRILNFDDVIFGYMLPSVAQKIMEVDPDSWMLNSSVAPFSISLLAGHNEATRSDAIAKTLQLAKDKSAFEILTKWRNERYPLYGPDGELVLRYERAATGLFGFTSHAVHMTAFIRTSPSPEDMSIWVPRRSATKDTYPGMLDQSVAGGLPAGERAWTCLIRECMEEASLPEEIASKSKMVGAVTYYHSTGDGSGGESGLLQPEVQYVYDLDLTEHQDVELKPNDGEVQQFYLKTVSEVKAALANGEFKPNCALMLVDFLMRHGVITIENEKDYVTIMSRLHRKLPFPMGACWEDAK
jgi:isopentenyldiphosphate isomerase